ncbi:MAG: biotin--[acetyl-CoA-carboxylase] ligase [Chloroflexi bacterium]|nr:MAG: biotin--[acetyl-CoA-carboxylase] ligase [Chloroflexota bacterium]
MADMENDLTLASIHSRLQTKWIGQTYHYFESVGSTNQLLKEQATSHNLPNGTVYLTDFQEAGRGRLARKWEAPPRSSLLISVLFRPDWSAQQANWLTMIASLAAAEAIEAMTQLKIAVKWPNDLMVMLDGVWHKLAGILLEGDLGENGRFHAIILGIGINVNIPAEQLPEAVTPASSLQVAVGQPLARLPLLLDFLARLEAHYEAANRGTSPQPIWAERLMMIGKPVQVTLTAGGQIITGFAEGTDTWGQLLVRDEGEMLHTIAAGDVTLREGG